MPVYGGVSGQERGADVDEGEVEQTHSHLHSVGVETTEASGPAEGKDIDGEVVERAHPSLHLPRQSHTMENPTVRESGYVGCFL